MYKTTLKSQLHYLTKFNQLHYIPYTITQLQSFLSNGLYFWENHTLISLTNQLNQERQFLQMVVLMYILCNFYLKSTNGKQMLVMYTVTIPDFKTSLSLVGFWYGWLTYCMIFIWTGTLKFFSIYKRYSNSVSWSSLKLVKFTLQF